MLSFTVRFKHTGLKRREMLLESQQHRKWRPAIRRRGFWEWVAGPFKAGKTSSKELEVFSAPSASWQIRVSNVFGFSRLRSVWETPEAQCPVLNHGVYWVVLGFIKTYWMLALIFVTYLSFPVVSESITSCNSVKKAALCMRTGWWGAGVSKKIRVDSWILGTES